MFLDSHLLCIREFCPTAGGCCFNQAWSKTQTTRCIQEQQEAYVMADLCTLDKLFSTSHCKRREIVDAWHVNIWIPPDQASQVDQKKVPWQSGDEGARMAISEATKQWLVKESIALDSQDKIKVSVVEECGTIIIFLYYFSVLIIGNQILIGKRNWIDILILLICVKRSQCFPRFTCDCFYCSGWSVQVSGIVECRLGYPWLNVAVVTKSRLKM